MSRVATSAKPWEVEAAVCVLDGRLVFCLPMHVYDKVGWCFHLSEWLRDCLLQSLAMEITARGNLEVSAMVIEEYRDSLLRT